MGVTDQGPVVYSPTGEVVTGQAAAEAIRQAQEFGVEVRQMREAGAATVALKLKLNLSRWVAGAREAGTTGIEIGRQTFERIGPSSPTFQTLIVQLNLWVAEEGADVGVLGSRFPQWRASTIELNNLRNELGIDVLLALWDFGA